MLISGTCWNLRKLGFSSSESRRRVICTCPTADCYSGEFEGWNQESLIGRISLKLIRSARREIDDLRLDEDDVEC